VPATVSNLNDAGAGSLRQAILDINDDTSQEPHSIQFIVTGTIMVQTSLPPLEKPTLVAGPGADALTLNGQVGVRMFTVNSPNCTIQGLKITDCDISNNVGGVTDKSGAAIAVFGGPTIVQDCVFRSNKAVNGGVIYSAAELQVVHSQFEGNSCTGLGGAIRATGGNLTIQDNTGFVLNQATDGFGGGVSFSSPGKLSVFGGVTFTLNGAVGAGGGLHITDGTADIQETTIGPGNLGGTGGGGIYIAAPTTLTNVTISTNSAENGGGIFVSSTGTLTRGTNVTIANNRGGNVFPLGRSAPSQGGGIYVEPGGTAVLVNTVVAENSADSGPDIAGEITSLGHNLISNSTGGTGYVASDYLDVPSDLGPLDDNGGLTKTHASAGPSPIIDGGDNEYAPVPYDQRGEGFDRIDSHHHIVDIGALEVEDPDSIIDPLGPMFMALAPSGTGSSTQQSSFASAEPQVLPTRVQLISQLAVLDNRTGTEQRASDWVAYLDPAPAASSWLWVGDDGTSFHGAQVLS
jgi:predicted outer membrane repeat protein